MKIAINNRQKLYRTNSKTIKALTKLILLQAARIDPEMKWEDVAVVLTDNSGIEKLNGLYLGKHDTTDVLSFRYDALPGQGGGGYTGEVIVNVERAVEYGKRKGRTGASRELALYIAHGCDHLYGSVDYNDTDRRKMRRRELAWLKNIGRDKSLSSDPADVLM